MSQASECADRFCGDSDCRPFAIQSSACTRSPSCAASSGKVSVELDRLDLPGRQERRPLVQQS